MGLVPNGIPIVERNGTPEQMLLGDLAYIKNYPEYRNMVGGAYIGENVIKVGRGQFFGWTGHNWREGVKTIAQWERHLQDEFNLARGIVPRADPVPGFTGEITFADVAKISMMVFDLRKQNLRR